MFLCQRDSWRQNVLKFVQYSPLEIDAAHLPRDVCVILLQVSFTFTLAWLLVTHCAFHRSEIYYLMNVGAEK